MDMSSPSDVAMVLPVPLPPGAGEYAMTFVDLSGYPDFFDDLGRRFFQMTRAMPESRGFRLSLPRLPVHQVGSFEASFVPSLQDFERLDPRFCLPAGVWEQLPNYADDGFAVFKFRRGRRQRIHPMALRFRTRLPKYVYFPTTHVHNGRVKPRAEFDHHLYWQTDSQSPDSDVFTQTTACPADEHMDLTRARGLVAGDRPVCLRRIIGKRDNRDMLIRA